MMILNPTGKEIRSDDAGDGHYHAKRGSRLHEGVDFVCVLHGPVLMPVTGKIIRLCYPYADKSYSGVYIKGDWCDIKMFYFKPNLDLIGKMVNQGDVIGSAQDITNRYQNQGMTPHIHLSITSISKNPELYLRN